MKIAAPVQVGELLFFNRGPVPLDPSIVHRILLAQ
jgi:hypothetical protein